MYSTNCFHTNSTKRVQIRFGLSKEVSFNAIIGISTLKQWKDSIIFEGNFLTSHLLQTQFSIICKHSNTGLPSGAAFDCRYYIRPREVTSSGQTPVVNMSLDNPNINLNSRVKPPSIFTIQEQLISPSSGINIARAHKLIHFHISDST